MSAKSENGLFILGARPIGDYKDSSLNLIEYIQTADVIMVENSFPFYDLIDELKITIKGELIDINVAQFFQSGMLISQANLNKNIYEHIQIAVDRVREGKTVLLLSDEGMSSIIDPGVNYITAFKRLNLPYKVMAGPSAITLAASISNLAHSGFTFLGMIQDNNNSNIIFERIRDSKYPTIVYLRTKDDMVEFLENMSNVVGKNRLVTFCFNITKPDEDIIEDTFENLLEIIANKRYNGGIAMVIGEYGRERKNV